MAELATIARPYAEALYKASSGDAATSQWLDALAAVAGNEQMLQFAGNPKATEQQVFDLMVGVSKAQLSESGRNFLRAIIDNGRLAALPEVARQFRDMKNAQSGSSDAVVHSAFPISDFDLGRVSAALEKRFGRKLNLTVVQDESLIGGIRVVVGDEVLDTSVKARLEQMKVALAA
ncbi:F0F1 ATP synthase subunit delta [Ramlibacter sp.]|uniref:F0F1 ATP synthase subunit delta n=1 Tax=Ramlibacter sp. TaxID=1917967 RepID=UPI003D147F67